MATKYVHRRLNKQEFIDLLAKAGMNINDFLYVSGRNAISVKGFFAEKQNGSYVPTMGDVLLLELVARGVIQYDSLADIVDEYSDNV